MRPTAYTVTDMIRGLKLGNKEEGKHTLEHPSKPLGRWASLGI